MGTQIVSAITSVFENLGDAILDFLKSGFTQLFYEDPTASTPVMSNLATFCFVILGISLVIGLSRWVTSLVRRKI